MKLSPFMLAAAAAVGLSTLVCTAPATAAQSDGATISGPALGMAPTDEVIYWNNVLLDMFRLDYGTGCPCPLARAGAMVQGAVYEAVNSIDREYEPYIAYVEVGGDASADSAVCAAAYRTLLHLFPNSAVTLKGHYDARKALIADGPEKFEGIRVGNRAARQMIENRTGDGSELPESYTFGTAPGSYVPVPPTFSPECNPQWTRVTPFTMTRNTQFRPRNGPCNFKNLDLLIKSEAYASQLDEVRQYGRRFNSLRTQDQTEIAFFWANDRNGTYKPPGHLFSITQTVSQQQGLSLKDNARLFALVGLAMGDAGIVAWDAKYATAIDLWRPVTAIRRAHLDGNAATVREPNWLPLNEFTPPFPAWISGHATFGGAHAAVMAGFFGTDNMTFTIDSEDPYYNALPNHPPRTFHSFSQAAIENGLSRVYLGVHFRMDASDGNAAGLALGRYVSRNFLKVRCIADFDASGAADSADFFAFYSAYTAEDNSADMNHDSTVDMTDLEMFMDAYNQGC